MDQHDDGTGISARGDAEASADSSAGRQEIANAPCDVHIGRSIGDGADMDSGMNRSVDAERKSHDPRNNETTRTTTNVNVSVNASDEEDDNFVPAPSSWYDNMASPPSPSASPFSSPQRSSHAGQTAPSTVASDEYPCTSVHDLHDSGSHDNHTFDDLAGNLSQLPCLQQPALQPELQAADSIQEGQIPRSDMAHSLGTNSPHHPNTVASPPSIATNMTININMHIPMPTPMPAHSHLRSQINPASDNNNNSSNNTGSGNGQIAMANPPMVMVGATLPSPGWKEISKIYLPLAARELLSSSIRRICYTARVSYAKGHWYRKYSDMGNKMGGFNINGPNSRAIDKSDDGNGNGNHNDNDNGNVSDSDNDDGTYNSIITKRLRDLPPISSLPWIDRQLVKEWRTYMPQDAANDAAAATSATEDSIYEDTRNHLSDDESDINNAQTSLPVNADTSAKADEEDFDFEQARALVPNPIERPKWQKSEYCFACHKPFGPTRLRHHCRLCGNSFCQPHSSSTHSLPHLGYDPDVKERVCDVCKQLLEEQNLAERVAWRLARCRDFDSGDLTPYFELGIDSYEQIAIRITKAAIAMAKTIPLGAQATVAVETVDVLRKYGLHGIYGLILRKEFLAAADLLRKALGINKTSWPLSVHELSAAIFYALAQHRAMRGLNPEREHRIHAYRQHPHPHSHPHTEPNAQFEHSSQYTTRPTHIDDSLAESALSFHDAAASLTSDRGMLPDPPAQHETPQPTSSTSQMPSQISREVRRTNTMARDADRATKRAHTMEPVCDPVSDVTVNSLLLYAPIALNFIYATREVDMQLLAAQQGWVLLYAHLQQDTGDSGMLHDRPASAVLVHKDHKIACLAIRGTATINDVITDIRQIPVPFPEVDAEASDDVEPNQDDDWTNVSSTTGIALCGMASAATNLYREHIDALVALAKQGYRIRITGHSLGGSVGTMVAILVLRHLRREVGELFTTPEGTESDASSLLRVYAYGTPSCMDANLAESVNQYVTTVVLHDDVFPRLTPTNCRRLLKHLLHIRETWVKRHMTTDLKAIGERAKTAWAPRFRQSFTIAATPARSIKHYYRKHFRSHKDNKDTTRHGQAQQESGGDFAKDGVAETTETFEETADVRSKDHLLDFLGGANGDTDGIIVDGDEFFDVEDDDLIESSDTDDANSHERPVEGGDGGDSDIDAFMDPMSEQSMMDDSWNAESFSADCNAVEQHKFHQKQRAQGKVVGLDETKVPSSDGQEHNGSDDDVSFIQASNAVVLEETPLPRMFVPGKVVHIYSHRGVYKAAYVPRTFRELRRISLAGNMLTDHTTKSYYEALVEVQNARVAFESPPTWTAFDEDDTCSCCASRFTWASTSNSEAQEARDKHNCRSCGGLVCDPCSKSRAPIPSIGITVPVRVCDKCYNDINGTNSSRASVQSFQEVDEEGALCDFPTGTAAGSLDQASWDTERSSPSFKPERQREKRSIVVDDLVSRIRSSSLAGH